MRWAALLAAAMLVMVAVTSCTETGCKAEQLKCNDRCGEGALGKLCKDVCTFKYNQCLNKK